MCASASVAQFGLRAARTRQPFHSWASLPDYALLAISGTWSKGDHSGIGSYSCGERPVVRGRFQPDIEGSPSDRLRTYEAGVVLTVTMKR